MTPVAWSLFWGCVFKKAPFLGYALWHPSHFLFRRGASSQTGSSRFSARFGSVQKGRKKELWPLSANQGASLKALQRKKKKKKKTHPPYLKGGGSPNCIFEENTHRPPQKNRRFSRIPRVPHLKMGSSPKIKGSRPHFLRVMETPKLLDRLMNVGLTV